MKQLFILFLGITVVALGAAIYLFSAEPLGESSQIFGFFAGTTTVLGAFMSSITWLYRKEPGSNH